MRWAHCWWLGDRLQLIGGRDGDLGGVEGAAARQIRAYAKMCFGVWSNLKRMHLVRVGSLMSYGEAGIRAESEAALSVVTRRGLRQIGPRRLSGTVDQRKVDSADAAVDDRADEHRYPIYWCKDVMLAVVLTIKAKCVRYLN